MFFQAEDGIRDLVRSRGLGDVYKRQGQISEDDYKNVIKNACPGPGACGGMYTANTMASAVSYTHLTLPTSDLV